MSRIFITGDTHSTIDFSKLNNKNFPIQKELNKSDVMIITGDVALCWNGDKSDEWLQNWYENRNFTTLAVDGNHEGFDEMEKLPIVKMFGGKVRKVSSTVFYTIRGEIYTINGKTFLVCGGADSTDKDMRVEHVSWWKQERITENDINNSFNNLQKVNNKVDYIITHTSGSKVANQLGFKPSYSDKMVDKILDNSNYNKHFCGHVHVDKKFDRTFCLYNNIIEIL